MGSFDERVLSKNDASSVDGIAKVHMNEQKTIGRMSNGLSLTETNEYLAAMAKSSNGVKTPSTSLYAAGLNRHQHN